MLVLSCRIREEIEVGNFLVKIVRIGKDGFIDLRVIGPTGRNVSISPERSSPSTRVTRANDSWLFHGSLQDRFSIDDAEITVAGIPSGIKVQLGIEAPAGVKITRIRQR